MLNVFTNYMYTHKNEPCIDKQNKLKWENILHVL